jgi:hypothetical protein
MKEKRCERTWDMAQSFNLGLGCDVLEKDDELIVPITALTLMKKLKKRP